MITAENLVKHELVGLGVSVVQSCNGQLVGLSGKIVDETKSMFFIQTGSGIKALPKAKTIWKFDLNGSNATIEGEYLAKRSYDRIGAKP